MAHTQKLVIIGIDSVSYGMIDTLMKHGRIPAISRLIQEGCFTEATPYFPVETGTNWAVISTGAYPATTGCNMSVHLPGTPLNQRVSGFPSTICKAEQIWGAANQAGKRCVIFDYPQSYPLNIDNVIHIGEDGRPDNSLRAISEVRAYVTQEPNTNPSWRDAHLLKVNVQRAEGWQNLPHTSQIPLEVELPVVPSRQSQIKSAPPFYALLKSEENRGYCKVSLHASRNYHDKLGEVVLGEWSDWIQHTFKIDDGVPAAFRMKLLKMSPDGTDMHLYLSQIYPTVGFAHPERLSTELVDACGPYITQPSRQQVVMGGTSDVQTYFEEQEYQAQWLARATKYVMTHCDWDLFIMKWHGSDWTNHLCAFMIDPLHPLYDPERAAEGWEFWANVLELGDGIIAEAMEHAGEDAIIGIVSDHGGSFSTPGEYGGYPDLNAILERAGFITRAPGGGVDWHQTKAYGSGHYVYINLKNRDPQGIVEPGGEYEKLRDDIIQLLLDQKHPETGKHLFNMVFRKEDARLLGVGGDRVGDIFLLPQKAYERQKMTLQEFTSKYPNIGLGTWDWPRQNSGGHSMDAFFAMKGPNLKPGYRRTEPVWLSYFAPTLCYAWDIPAPKHADGGVVWDFISG